MNLEEQCNLSYFMPVAPINEDHEVFLVQHATNNKFYVRKRLQYFNLKMLNDLKNNPIPDMPRIYELFEESGTLFVIEEYISGLTLEEILSDNGPLSEQNTISYINQLCSIVKNLHSRKPPIIHRDIKPSNIIIAPDGKLKLLDLSAAKLSDPSKSQDTVMMGTTGYAAPEQYGFSTSSTLTDIYAIGVLMNRMLTGEMLHVKKYSGRLSPVINKCTRLDPSERYQSIRELEQAISDTISPDKKESQSISDLIMKYRLPGFRSGKIIPSLFALAGYILLFYTTLTLNVDNPTKSNLLINRAGATIAFLLVILFSGNYLDCQKLLPLSRSENRLLKVIGIILWDIIILLIIVLLITALEG